MKQAIYLRFAITVCAGMAMFFSAYAAESAKKGVTPYFGSKSPTEKKAVGDIVFSDGSSTPYSEELSLTDGQKAAAIAVIFYSGDGILGSRTLGVGLSHNKDGLIWCTSDAKAYKADLNSIKCSVLGDTWKDVAFEGDTDGSDNLEQTAADLGSNDDTKDAKKYPAFYFAKNYKSQDNSRVSGTQYEEGWYLPTVAELIFIWMAKSKVDPASAMCGGNTFGSDWYWSATQNVFNEYSINKLGFDYGWGIGFKGNKFYDLRDEIYLSVCAVRAF